MEGGKGGDKNNCTVQLIDPVIFFFVSFGRGLMADLFLEVVIIFK